MILEEPQLLLTEESDGCFAVVLRDENGREERLPAATPAEALIAVSEINYSDYRREVRRLWDEHSLFEERPIVRVEEPRSMDGVSRADFEDFIAQASVLPNMLQGIDPLIGVWVQSQFWSELQAQDDGSAIFLLNTGGRILKTLGEPFLTQVYLRNILEVTFDGTERSSQSERFEKLRQTYPDIARYCDPKLLGNSSEGKRIFTVHSIFDLYLLELALYFQQEKQRIARCNYCWGYFIPKTKKVTRYCDRVTDGQSCKQRGANLARRDVETQDEALLICNQLRDRMYARWLRYQDAAPFRKGRLIPVTYEDYDAWSENARLARMAYLRGELTSEEFLRRIDTTHELSSYEASKVELTDELTVWQQRVAHDWSFDPETVYPGSMMSLDLTPGHKNKWEIHTRDDLRRRDQEGHQSLKEKYRKE